MYFGDFARFEEVSARCGSVCGDGRIGEKKNGNLEFSAQIPLRRPSQINRAYGTSKGVSDRPDRKARRVTQKRAEM